MKAAVLRELNAPLSIEDVDIDKPGPNEVLTRTAASGICHSDLHIITGDMPMMMPCILGHEPAGVVEAVGENVTDFQPGDHVIGCLNAWCGSCNYCLTGRPHLCMPPQMLARLDGTSRLTQNGEPIVQFALSSFAENMLTHERALVGQHVLGEGRKRKLDDRLAVLGESGGAVEPRQHLRWHAEVGTSRQAVVAAPAPCVETADHVIAGLEVGHVLADCLDDARRFVAEDAGHHHRHVAGDDVEIAVADARRGGPGQDLVGARLVDVDVLDRERGVQFTEDGGFHGRLLTDGRFASWRV